jgi:hypothetical protein
MIAAYRGKACRLSAVLLCLACGCQLFPWPGDNAAHPADPAPRPAAPHLPPLPPRGDWDAEHPPAPGPPPNEQITLLSEHVREAEDDRKVLNARLQQMTAQLEEKDRALVLAQHQIQEATAQVARTRKELQAWQTDVTALTVRLRTAERDNRDTLETITRTLEKMLREREPARGPDAAGPELLPLPRQP